MLQLMYNVHTCDHVTCPHFHHPLWDTFGSMWYTTRQHVYFAFRTIVLFGVFFHKKHEMFWNFLYIVFFITNGTLMCVTWAFVVHHQIKLFNVCHVYGFKILKLLIYWKCQYMTLCHMDTYVTHLHDTWYLVVCRSSNICEVEPK
jgi:hypothetical protein